MSLSPVFSPSFSISFFDSNFSEESSSVTCPDNVNAGDLIVYFDRSSNNSNSPPAAVTPSGFTLAVASSVAVSGFSQTQRISYKKAAGTEGGSSISGMNGANDGKVIMVFRPNFNANYTVVDADEEAIGGNPADQTVTSGSSTNRRPLIVFGGYGVNQGTLGNPSMTPAEDGFVTAIAAGTLAYKIYNTTLIPVADVVIGMADEGAVNVLQSFYIQTS